MSFQLLGNTHSVPLPNVLQMLQYGQVTGVLKIRREQTEKCVHFRNGQIVFATSTDEQDRLGEMLVKAGFLKREHLESALVQYRKTGGMKKIGAILVENGYVSPKNLFSGLKTQVKDIIYSIFLWSEGEYRFEEQLPPDTIQLQINLQELIAECIERMKKET